MRLPLVVTRILLLLAMAGLTGCGGGSLVHSDDRDAVEALEEGGLFDIQLHDDGKARVAILKKPKDMTDEMMRHLAGLDELQILHLTKAAITDAGLEHVAGLSKLDQLVLKGTGITDAGLVHLERLANLETLDLTGTRVSEDAVEALREKAVYFVIYGDPSME
ncbi:MAG: hypothetical protein IID41_01435 [Planctomycetes bacterium]|nr:hypothetical protein [Planctomycetota bacterium]